MKPNKVEKPREKVEKVFERDIPLMVVSKAETEILKILEEAINQAKSSSQKEIDEATYNAFENGKDAERERILKIIDKIYDNDENWEGVQDGDYLTAMKNLVNMLKSQIKTNEVKKCKRNMN